MLADMAIISRYAAFVDIQRENDYPNGYRAALLSFSEALDQSRDINSPFFTEKAYHIDKALTYHRLSRLENEVGNSEKVAEYSALAEGNCAKAGWASCSPERLDEVVEKLTKNSLFAAPE